MTDFIQVQITFPSADLAHNAAEALVAQKYAACAQVIGTITSYYTWKDRNEKSEEYLLLAKTHRDKFEPLAAFVRTVHPYECPQIAALPLAAATEDYSQWLKESVCFSAFP